MNKSTFAEALLDKILISLPNDYKDNDFNALTKIPVVPKITWRKRLADRLAPPPETFPKWMNELAAKNYLEAKPYLNALGTLYDELEDGYSKDLFVQLIAYRILGYHKVKLPVNSPDFMEKFNKLKQLADSNKAIDSGFRGWKLDYIDLKSFGKEIKMYFSALGSLVTFINEQYRYQNGPVDIVAGQGDVVMDCGGCWGDTALYFAEKVGDKGKVFSFEFIPKNIKHFNQNLDLNPTLKQRVNLVENPLWDKPGIPTYFIDNGPASKVSFEKMSGVDGVTATETIDHLVEQRALQHVDYIKMDIEGAETFALNGAEQTIRRFKPKLAISIYHSYSDMEAIPRFIKGLGLGYKLYLGHYTWLADETVLFALPPAK